MPLSDLMHENFLHDFLLSFPLLYWLFVDIQGELGTYVLKMT